MKIKDALRDGAQRLSGATPTPNLDAELILCWIYDWDRIQIILNSDRIMQEDDEIRYSELIDQRKTGKPVQYIVRKQEFMGLPFYVDERVLIPRGDTEILVEKVLERLQTVQKPRILDVCTGSGAIAISLARFCETAEVVGTDVSEDALEVAGINGRSLQVSQRVNWLLGNLYEALGDDISPFDLIVSNPPYIATEVIAELEPNVRDHEPKGALDGGHIGLDFYPVLIAGSVCRLKPFGILAFEIGWDQGPAVMDMILASGHFEEPELIKDLAGHDRVVLARKKPEFP